MTLDTFDFVQANPFTFKIADADVSWYYKKLTPLVDSSIFAKWGDTAINVAVLRGEGSEETEFLPLTIEYLEKYYAAGIIASSPYVKREGHPSEAAILKARIIDRAIRPRLPKNLRDVIQVYVSVLSYDAMHDPLLLAFNTTVAAFMASSIPFEGDMAGIKVTVKDNKPVLLFEDIPLWDNQGRHKAQLTDMDMFLALDQHGVVMVDAFANELSEDITREAISLARSSMQDWLVPLKDFTQRYGVEKKQGTMVQVPKELIDLVENDFSNKVSETLQEKDKILRREKLENLPKEAVEYYIPEDQEETEFEYTAQQVRLAIEKLLKKHVKDLVLKQNERVDGRDFNEIRRIYIEVDLLPKAHGSALFKRGDTAVMTVVTLASLLRKLQLDEMTGEEERRYIHEYYSPPYSFGEPGRFRVYPGRREIGHGALAQKAVFPVLPDQDQFPYMIRAVSEVLSSAGSTSMASTTASSLALMSAGVPISRPVTGISIGIVGDEEFNEYKLLTDIVEVEDFYGEMDFKVTGTVNGITAIQMDQKRLRIPYQAINQAFDKAKDARLFLLKEIEKIIDKPRDTVAKGAPKVVQVKVPVEDIGRVIGPGGRVIKDIMEKTNSTINIEEDGTVSITANKEEDLKLAKEMINEAVSGTHGGRRPAKEYKIGEELEAEIVDIRPFGAFVKFLDGTDTQALVHISEIADSYIKNIEDVLSIGEHVKVKVIDIDDRGRIKASIKQAQ